MKNKTINKKNFFSKFIAKIVRKFGYEIIDQANLKIPGTNKLASENLSKSGSRSITVPLRMTNITNKIHSLTIIIRSNTFGDTNNNRVMLDQNKKRIFLPHQNYSSVLKLLLQLLKEFFSCLKDHTKYQKINLKKDFPQIFYQLLLQSF